VIARTAVGDDEPSRALLGEIEPMLTVRETWSYNAFLPPMVRALLKLGVDELAGRLTDWHQRHNRYDELSVGTARAALAEARGDIRGAADAYDIAAGNWERFGIVPEHAFALLGQGRCLLTLDRPAAAALVLERAREVFERLTAGPALAETEALIERSSK
jgi:hypothetical protein